MKKNSRYALYIVSILTFSHAAVIGVAIQDKQSVYSYLAELENQKKVVYRAYTTALLNAVNQHEKDALYKEYVKKMSSISQQEKEQRKYLQSIHQQELWWSGAKFLGGIALLGLLTYNLLTTADGVEKGQSLSESSLASKPLVDDQQQVYEYPEDNSLVVDNFQASDNITQGSVEIPVMIQKPQSLITPEEKALYALRYKNYRNSSALSFLTTMAGLFAFGPVALPIDFVLLGISALSGFQALHYHQQLYPGVSLNKNVDIKRHGILLDTMLSR